MATRTESFGTGFFSCANGSAVDMPRTTMDANSRFMRSSNADCGPFDRLKSTRRLAYEYSPASVRSTLQRQTRARCSIRQREHLTDTVQLDPAYATCHACIDVDRELVGWLIRFGAPLL